MNSGRGPSNGFGISVIVLIALLFPGAALSQTTVRYIHTDALGSPVAITDAAGNTIEQDAFDPYGGSLTSSPQDAPSFAGHVRDASTGLSYMQQRYYDPQLGVFLSVDPVTPQVQPQIQFNRYRYANNNPYRFTDPDGRTAVCGRDSCVIDCTSVLSCWVDHVYVAGEYRNRQILNAIESALPVRQHSQPTNEQTPSLPGGLLGTTDGKSRQQGDRVNNGPLAPENGGTGDAEKDFEGLTGGKTVAPPQDSKLPAGSRIGENGVIYRPASSKSGPRIDIPQNGDKPHETLHYPIPPPPPKEHGL